MRESLRNIGLLILRLGFGFMFIFHGAPKLFGDAAKWESVGMAVRYFGIESGYAWWGFAAGLAECGGGLLLVLGLMVRPAAFFMAVTMVVAATKMFMEKEGLGPASQAIEAGVAFLSLVFLGAGRYSMDAMMQKKSSAPSEDAGDTSQPPASQV